MVLITRDEAEQVLKALTDRATEDMRYRAWELLDKAIKAAMNDGDIEASAV